MMDTNYKKEWIIIIVILLLGYFYMVYENNSTINVPKGAKLVFLTEEVITNHTKGSIYSIRT